MHVCVHLRMPHTSGTKATRKITEQVDVPSFFNFFKKHGQITVG